MSAIHELVREDESSAGLLWGWGDAKLRGGGGLQLRLQMSPGVRLRLARPLRSDPSLAPPLL